MSGGQTKQVTFIRHGDTGMGGRYIGSTDVGLSVKGVEQVTSLGRKLQGGDIHMVWCSPLRRCRETLAALSLPQQAIFAEELSEISFGAWEGLTFNQITDRYPAEVQQWAENPESFAFPGGEAIRDFRHRVSGILHQFYHSRSSSIVAITHGGVIRAALCELLALPWQSHLLFEVQNARCTCLHLFTNCRGILTGFNLEAPQWHD